MNLRCIYCQTPFTLSRAEMLSAIVLMNEKGMNHYDGHCPRCRRANSISRQRMELFFPNWQEAAKKQASANAEAARIAVKDETPASAFLKTEPLSKAMKAAIEKKTKGKQLVKVPAKTAKKPVASKAKAPAAAKKAAVTKKK
jgi:hypothetical protein